MVEVCDAVRAAGSARSGPQGVTVRAEPAVRPPRHHPAQHISAMPR